MPPAVVTVTSTVPTVPAGEVATICVALLEVILALVEPNLTDVAEERFVPVMVTVVPPEVGPLEGEILVLVTLGASTNVN